MRRCFLVLLLVAHTVALLQRECRSATNSTLQVVACREQPPWVTQQDNEGENSAIVGIEVELLAQACAYLGITFKIVGAPINDAKAQIENGMADVLLCARVIDGQKEYAADYSDPHTISGHQIAQRADSIRTQTWIRMVWLVFTARAAFYLVAAFVVIMIAAVLVSLAEKRCASSFRQKGATEATYMLQTFEWAAGLIVPQTALRMNSVLESRFSRVVAAAGGMLANVLLAAFFATAVSVLLFDSRDIIVPFHPSLLKGLHVGVVQGGTATMITSGQGSWGLEFQKIRSITHFPTLDDLLVALSDGRVDAAVHEAKSLQAHLAKSTGKLYPEHIVLASSPSRTIYVGFEFPIGSPFRLPINRALQALRDAGHLHDQQAIGYSSFQPRKATSIGMWTLPNIIMGTSAGSLLLASALFRCIRSKRQDGNYIADKNRAIMGKATLGTDVDREALKLVRGSLDAPQARTAETAAHFEVSQTWRLVLEELEAEKEKMAITLGRKRAKKKPDSEPTSAKYDLSNGFAGAIDMQKDEKLAQSAVIRLFGGAHTSMEVTQAHGKQVFLTADMIFPRP